MLAVLMLVIAGTIGVAIFNPFHVERSLHDPFVVMTWLAISVVALVPIIWVHATSMSRAWSHNLQLRVPHELIADDSTVTERWETSSVQTTWDKVATWKETTKTVVIRSNLGLFIIPKGRLSPSELNALMAYLNTKVIHGTGGFPVEVTRGRADSVIH